MNPIIETIIQSPILKQITPQANSLFVNALCTVRAALVNLSVFPSTLIYYSRKAPAATLVMKPNPPLNKYL
jgi:hypothetical protein